MYNKILPTTTHSAIIWAQTGCGKTAFIQDLLEGCYRGVFEHISMLCPTVKHNETYQQRKWFGTDNEIYKADQTER